MSVVGQLSAEVGTGMAALRSKHSSFLLWVDHRAVLSLRLREVLGEGPAAVAEIAAERLVTAVKAVWDGLQAQ